MHLEGRSSGTESLFFDKNAYTEVYIFGSLAAY